MKFGSKALFSVMIRSLLVCCIVLLGACQSNRTLPFKSNHSTLGGSDFYKDAADMGWAARDSLIVRYVRQGAVPAFLAHLVPVRIRLVREEQKKVQITFFVAPDYLSVGNNNDWARVSLTAKGAAMVLSMLDCFAPTPLLADLIYRQARVKLPPVPLYAFRDSTPVMWHHHLIIEGQRKQQKGLIAGIKKDIVFIGPRGDSVAKDRVGIYGWHQPDGKPIQPFYQGHAWWYTDYSHGLRLVSRYLKVGRRWTTLEELRQDSLLYKQLF